MKLVHNKKQITLCECKSFFSRFKGFMFTKEIKQALLFNHCNSIHTFFMITNIDVILCDRENKVLFFYNNLGKNKIIWPKKKVFKVIELPVNYFDIKIGDYINIEK